MLALENLPLWHNAMCRNEHHQTSFSPHFVRQGVLYWKDMVFPRLIAGLAHTYKPPYRLAASCLLHVAHTQPIEWFCPGFWEFWGSRDMVKHVEILPVGFVSSLSSLGSISNLNFTQRG